MGYYDDKQKANLDINSEVEKGSGEISVNQLVYFIENRYGFGVTFVKKRLKLMEKLGDISVDPVTEIITLERKR